MDRGWRLMIGQVPCRRHADDSGPKDDGGGHYGIGLNGTTEQVSMVGVEGRSQKVRSLGV